MRAQAGRIRAASTLRPQDREVRVRVPSKSAAALLAALACAAPAAAGESGSFTFIESAVHGYTVLEHAGQTVTAGPLQGTGSVVASSGGPFVAGSHYRAVCLVYAGKSEAGIDLEAPCTFTDADGDAWYGLAQRQAGDVAVGGGGQGSQRILGGTGKYAGVTGDCPYETAYLPDNWTVSTASCQWQRP